MNLTLNFFNSYTIRLCWRHIILYTYRFFLTKISSNTHNYLSLIFDNIKCQISKLNHTSWHTIACFWLWIYIVRPLTLKTLHIVTAETHFIVNCIAFVASEINRIQVKLVITTCTVFISRFNTIIIFQQRIYYITLRWRITTFPTDVALAIVRSNTVSVWSAIALTNGQVTNTALVSRITLTNVR